jgi:autophagy-related protein 9
MTGSGGSVMNMSTLLATGPAISSDAFIDPANAPSVTLGDSHHASPQVQPTSAVKSDVLPEDIVADGGVRSNLGESYVDGAHRFGGINREEEEEDVVEDGGVLGLLAQIYGRRDGPPVGF